MPDINVISISPSQLSGTGEPGLYDTAPFARKYLAQGDSWFSIGTFPPWSTTNLLQQMVLSRSTLSVNCAKPGAVLSHMTDTTTARVFLNLLNGNAAWKWDALLMSGGGNDLIDAANTAPSTPIGQRLLLTSGEWGSGGLPSRYLSDAGWATFEAHMNEVVDLLLAQRDKKALNRDIPVFFHTYDHVTPRNSPAGLGKGPWLFKAVNAYGIPPADWNAVSDELMNRHATMWLAIEARLTQRNLHVVDSRGATTRAAAATTGQSNDWENEIHPTPAGYSLLARKWRPSWTPSPERVPGALDLSHQAKEQSMGKLKFEADTPLYTTAPGNRHKAWRMQDAQAALAEVYARGKPVVVFVHGRGKEPNKSLRGATFAKGMAVWKLELGYDCSVVMFNWDSAFPGILFLDRSRALANTVDGGRRLTELLGELSQFELSRPTMAKPALLAHSMGSIVLQHAVQGGAWPTGAPLFSQVVLTEPDANDVGHSEWLGMLGTREKVFSTQNADDKVLKQSTDARPAGAHALGLSTTEPLAPNVKYIDLTSMGALGAADDDHEVFGKGAMNGRSNVCAFFEQALLGKTVTLDDSNVTSITRKVVYTLKQRSVANAPCLRIPALPEFAE